MIQNILTFCVKNDLTYVSGSIPSGKLVANDVNRNSIYLITPYDEAIVKANFQTNLQSDTPTSVLGILVNGEIEVSELVDTNASYYNLVKDWNIYEFKVPSTTLSFISRNRTGKIGINFSIEQRLVPMIKVSYGTYKGEITELSQTPTEDGYYIIKALGYEYEDTVELKSFDLNDILVYNATTDVATKISAYSNRGSTPTTLYSVDPSLLNDNFETIEPSLTAQIVQQVNDNTSDILLLNQGVLNDGVAIVDLQNRMSVAEQDIDTAEANIVNLQGRMTTAEGDIDDIEDGTTIVKKAEQDESGRVIEDTYASQVEVGYGYGNRRVAITLKNPLGQNIATSFDTIPLADISTDGLMPKEDKLKVNNMNTTIDSKITTHDTSAMAHLSLRTLIANLQSEIDRLNAKGRSWGEIDLTFSQWFALTEPTRSNYINTFLATAFSGYTPSNGDLVYTIVSDTEEEHELEYNSTLSQWVDNGAYIVSKASNDQYGIVKGDLTYVSVLNGIIQVLKSDYATNVGSSGASYDYADLLALFTEVANDIYKKNETYSATQIEQRLTDLLALANLQDTLIGTYTNGQTVLASDLSPYNFIVALGKDAGTISMGIFKPSEINAGEAIYLSSAVYLSRGNDEFQAFTPTSIKLWGIKLDGITADEIATDFSGTNYLDGKTTQEAVNLELDTQIKNNNNAIAATNTNVSLLDDKVDITRNRVLEVEEQLRKIPSGDDVIVASGTQVVSLGKDVASGIANATINGGLLQATQLVPNGDFSNGFNNWSTYGGTSVVSNGIATATANGTGPHMTFVQTNIFTLGQKYYIATKIRVLDSVCQNIGFNEPVAVLQVSPTMNQWYFVSNVVNPTAYTRLYVRANYVDASTAVGKQMEADFVYDFNITNLINKKQFSPIYNKTFDTMSDAEIKIQMDAWVLSGELPNDNIQYVNGNRRLVSKGKNLFDGIVQQGNIDDSGVSSGDPQTVKSVNFIRVKPSVQLTYKSNVLIGGKPIVINRYVEYNSDKVFLRRVLVSLLNPENYTPSADCYFVKLVFRFPTLAPLTAQNVVDSQVQLELGSTATTYEPYVSSDLFIEAPKLYQLPNLVKDTIEVKNGKYVYVKRLGSVVVVGVVAVNTTNYPLAKNTGQFINYKTDKTYDLGVVGTNSTTGDGTLFYELATPQETILASVGNVIGYTNGTVEVYPQVRKSTIYNNGITTTLPIKSIIEVVKLNTDGTKTIVGGTNVIAGDKLSFTNSTITNGDLIIFIYEYVDADDMYGKTDITFWNARNVLISPNGTAYRIKYTVDNSGVLTMTTEAI